MDNIDVFVSGATGFIGLNLCHLLAGKGFRVHALYRSEKKAQLLKHPNIIPFKGTITNTGSLERAMENCSEAYHLAALARPWVKNKDDYDKINTDAAGKVFETARKKGIQKLVFTSTAGTLGPSFDQPVNENTQRNYPFFNDYERTKFQAEEIAKDYSIRGFPIVIVNPTRVYGPGLLSESNAVTKMIRLYTQGKMRFIPGDGQSIGNYVFIDDVALGHYLAMKRGRAGERYILSGDNVSYLVFFDTLAQITGKNLRQIRLPIWLMMAASGIMLYRAAMTGIKPPITPEWVRKYNFNWKLSGEKAVKELDYRITPLHEGVKKTLEWLRNKDTSFV
jgi:NAD+-dependent farnesol dehydrogenase